MNQKVIHFYADGYRLVGTLHLPEKRTPPVIIGCHGLFANRQSPKQISLANACTDNGFAYLRFDHRGCGDSQGDFNTVTSLAARSSDLYHAVQTIIKHPGTGDLYALFGSSFGGSVALSYSSKHPIRKIITYAAPLSSDTINHVTLETGFPSISIHKKLIQSLEFDLSPYLNTISNILIVHGEKDTLVPISNATTIYENTNMPKKLIVQENGDHRMSDPNHQLQFTRLKFDSSILIFK